MHTVFQDPNLLPNLCRPCWRLIELSITVKYYNPGGVTFTRYTQYTTTFSSK